MIYCNYISHSQKPLFLSSKSFCVLKMKKKASLHTNPTKKKLAAFFFLRRRRDRKRKRSLYQREMNPIYEAFAILLSVPQFSSLFRSLFLSFFFFLFCLFFFLPLFNVLLYLSISQFLENSFSLN